MPAAQQCRQALALGLDVSLSVDPAEFRLQREGLARALLDDAVVNALLTHSQAHVELAVFEWSSAYEQALVVDWTPVESRQALAGIARLLTDTPRVGRLGRTALGAAMRFGHDMLRRRPGCTRRTLDMSGDGLSNTGPDPASVRAAMEAARITVNGLVIGRAPGTPGSGEVDIRRLSRYFRDNVIAGPSAFVESVQGFAAYEAAMRRKLLRELAPAVAASPPAGLPRATAALHPPPARRR